VFIQGETFDDLLRQGIELILHQGERIRPTKGPARELVGASLALSNPRARFSRTEARSVLYSALGETLWYLSGSDRFDDIEYYIPHYRERCGVPADVQVSEAAYGPRIAVQMPYIIQAIRKNDTRNAVLAIYREDDHHNRYDTPCTCSLQFLPRSGKLHAVAQMRSNDLYMGMAHDIFAFTMIQEILARTAKLELGSYTHHVGSFHLYESDEQRAARYLESGVADTVPMDPMPVKDPATDLEWLMQAERAIRIGQDAPSPDGVNNYWQDLASLLEAKREQHNKARLIEIRAGMHSHAFGTFLQDAIGRA